MKLSKIALRITLALALTAPIALAQSAATDAKPSADNYETYHLANVSQQDEMNQVVTALRNMMGPTSRLFLVSSQNAILIEGSPDQIILAKKLLSVLDSPRKTYRLTYTLREMDDSKQVGIQHFSVIVVAGQRTTLRNGSKVPVATGSYSAGTHDQQTQFTYLDVGLNIDASLDESVNGVRLRSRIERSSVAEDRSNIAGVQEPVIRQTTLEGTSILTQGKPVTLGSLDVPGSTRHLDIDVVLAVVP